MDSRIAIFLPDLRGAGAERVALRLAEGIAGRGHQVDLVVAAATGSFADDVPASVDLVDLGTGRVLTAAPALARYLRSARPAVLLSHIAHANVVAVLARALSGPAPWRRGRAHASRTRVVVVEHNTLSARLAGASSLTDRRLTRPAMRLAYPWADARVGVSAGVAKDLLAELGHRVHPVIDLPNPVITDDFMAAADQPVDHPLLDPAARPVLLGIGRLEPQKRFDRLVDAYAAAGPAADLVILGEGDLRPALEAQVARLGLQDRVHLPGFVDNPAAWLRAAVGFVLSSDFEGLPTVLIEALAVGTPVVATDCPSGPREILDGGRHGVLVPVTDVDALSRAIGQLDRGEVQPAPAAAARYRTEQVVDAYLDVLLPG